MLKEQKMRTKVNSFHREKEISGHNGAVYTISASDSHIYSGSADRFVARWKILEGTQDNFSIRLEHPVYATCLAEDLLFIGLNNGDLHIVDITQRKELKYYQQHKVGIFEITYNSEMRHVYIADADGNLSVWSCETLELVIYLPLDCGKIRNISVSSDGSQFALGGQDGVCRVFDAKNFNETAAWLAHKAGVTGVLLENERVITGGKDALLSVWDLKGNEINKPIPAHNFGIYRILRLNDELILTASRDKSIKVWDNDLGFLQKLDVREGGHKHSVNELVKIGPQRFASCSDDGKIILWSSDRSV
jgi:WD40 repeat protein